MTGGAPKRREPAISREAGLAMMMPTLMLSGVLVGLLLGWGSVRLFDLQPPWNRVAMISGILVGAASGIRETYKAFLQITKK